MSVGSCRISRTYSYDSTRLNGITHKKNGVIRHKYLWNCDGRSRITSQTDNVSGGYSYSYDYDAYGQLHRENNEAYGKTMIYSYDNTATVTFISSFFHTVR